VEQPLPRHRLEAAATLVRKLHYSQHSTEELMLFTIAMLLVLMWLLGMVSTYTLGGFIHLLLVLAIIAVLIRLIQGRAVV
jgi:hypothetical protein